MEFDPDKPEFTFCDSCYEEWANNNVLSRSERQMQKDWERGDMLQSIENDDKADR